MKFAKWVFLAAFLFLAGLGGAITGQRVAIESNKSVYAQAGRVKPKIKHGRGFKLPSKKVAAAQHRISNKRYGHFLRKLPTATQAAYDAYKAPGGSCVPPIGDQGQCGNCYMWSGMKVCSAAQMTAGVIKPGSVFMLSTQWGLDCHEELGGCGGGDEYQVAQVVQSGGAPSTVQYTGAGQSPGTCQSTKDMTLYTVSSLVYCDPAQTSQGVASTQSIKNCILAYGYVSVAVAAGDDWDNYTAGQTLVGTSNQINHAVGATGWDDNNDNGDGTKGAFIGDNQWGTGFGNNGRFLIKYGAEGFGTEAFVALVNPPPSPPPVVTVTPQTATVGAAFSYQVVAANSPTSWSATGLPIGLVIDAKAGLISGTPTTAGVAIPTITATNAAGSGSATLQITVGTGPVPPTPPIPPTPGGVTAVSAVITMSDGSTQTIGGSSGLTVTGATTLQQLVDAMNANKKK